ncbi:MAG: CRISPR-associated endonuclease Cas3'' [Polyangiales bacterium]
MEDGRRGEQALAHGCATGRAHLLADHLRKVGALAARFGAVFGSEAWSALAGRWHDVGKYAADFQAMLREAQDQEAHIEAEEAEAERGRPRGRRRVDHSSAGAVFAQRCYPRHPCGLALSFAIAGHHAGMPDHKEGQGRSLEQRLRASGGRLDAACAGGFVPECPPAPSWPEMLTKRRDGEMLHRVELWTRMLFSTLVDADFLDTESFYNPEKTADRAGFATLATLRVRLDAHLQALASQAEPTCVNRTRAKVLAHCRAAATRSPGVFSLTVPTGGGKTLASLAFALAHAQQHGLRRVVVAIPFTSIIEQSAASYRAALGQDALIEHHCHVDLSKETGRNRLATENWDAPLVVTTNVQLLESLLSNRPSRCRKLHRLAQSVIVLDEAQSVPPELLDTILQVLRTLVQDYGCTLVLCTATQPALQRSAMLPNGFEPVHEIVPDPRALSQGLRRTRVEWPDMAQTPPPDWQPLACALAQTPSVLAIVDRRAAARDLTETLDKALGDPSTVHLSGLMCAAHRSACLAAVRRKLAQGEAVRLVSTQLVEAGVDIDFPVVFRAMAGLEAIVQAAGRCNREGRHKTAHGLGHVQVFCAPQPPPRGLLRRGHDVALAMLRANPNLDPFDPDTLHDYFAQLLWLCDRDLHGIEHDRKALKFRTVAQKFRTIAPGHSSIFIPYGARGRELEAKLRQQEPSRMFLRQLQPFFVSISERDFRQWQQHQCLDQVWDAVWILKEKFRHLYCDRFGLYPQANMRYEPDDLVV